MATHYEITDPKLVSALHNGQVGVLPTDTLYGLVASARLPEAVQRVYDLKGRSDHKPCIILVDSVETARTLGMPLHELEVAAAYWPASLSVIFSSLDPRYEYLQRELGWPPLRVPADPDLRHFLAQSGPLIAPSANMQGEPPAQTIQEAERVFDERVDFYVDGGRRHGEPSTLVRVEADGTLAVLRHGAFKL